MTHRPAAPTALITGATGAIGAAIARGLLQQGCDLVIVVRDEHRGRHAAQALAGAGRIRVERCDLSLGDDIGALARRLPERLDVLVNAAAECPRERQETRRGIERQWATNVLGYHFMTLACVPALARAKNARVVNVASYWAGGLELDDVEFRRRRYDNDAAYRQSKQADRMLSRGLADRLRSRGIAVNACHPGDVRSRLSTDLGFGGHESADEAAQTPVWLALAPELAGVSGKYFAHRRQEPCSFAQDEAGVAALLELCDAYTARLAVASVLASR